MKRILLILIVLSVLLSACQAPPAEVIPEPETYYAEELESEPPAELSEPDEPEPGNRAPARLRVRNITQTLTISQLGILSGCSTALQTKLMLSSRVPCGLHAPARIGGDPVLLGGGISSILSGYP